MARLIDADALMKEHCGECTKDVQESCKTDAICGSMMWIVEAPTVDAVPVVHGRWIFKENTSDYGGRHILHCSECDFPHRRARNYCPNCGARMDLEVE